MAGSRTLNPIILHLVNLMQTFLSGQWVKFDFNLLAFETCSNFQQCALLAENSIPISFPVIEPLDLIGHWEDIREAWK